MSPVVRDAAALRRHWNRREGRWAPWDGPDHWSDGTPAFEIDEVRKHHAQHGEDYYLRELGLAAYVPDPPMPLPRPR